MKRTSLSIISGLLLIAAALCLTGYNLWDDRRAGVESVRILDSILPELDPDPVPREGRIISIHTKKQQIADAEIEYPDYVLDPNMDMPVRSIYGNDYIGVLSVPAIGRELPVMGEWDYTKLETAPCRYTGSAYLDSMVICAHNYDSHFGKLKDLSYGDSVVFTDMDGNVFTYKVVEVETVQPTAIEEMTPGDWDLTLFTCTLGGATRVAVRCERELNL